MSATPYCSLIMLIESESHDFVEHFLALHNKLDELSYPHDMTLLANGTGHFVHGLMEQWPADAPPVNIVELARKVPSSVCLQTLVTDCEGKLLIICGPYQQIGYEGFDLILLEVATGKVDLALPWRQKRVDQLVNRCQSWVFNWLVRKMTGMRFHDLSCLVRIVRKPVIEEVPLYGDLYRYLPLLASRRGFKVKEYPVPHRQERGKVGFFGFREYVSRFVDLFGMHFSFGYSRKPLRYFGFRGLILFLLGAGCMLFALFQRILSGVYLGNSTLLMVGLLLMASGSSIWGIGLLGEIMSFVLGRNRKDYIIDKILK